MADVDFSKMKVVELRRELKARNLDSVGDKKELIERLQSATAKEDDSLLDDLGSDILDDEVEKEHDLSECQTESEGSEVHSTSKGKETVLSTSKRLLKRKPPSLASDLDTIAEAKLLSPESPNAPDTPPAFNSNQDSQVPPAKKIVLNRISAPLRDSKDSDSEKTPEVEVKNIKAVDPVSRLEIRAKRFGVAPVPEARKEARKQRFGNGNSAVGSTTTSIHAHDTPHANDLEKLKQRAERFGGSVSTVMAKLEMQERLLKRKEKFGVTSK